MIKNLIFDFGKVLICYDYPSFVQSIFGDDEDEDRPVPLALKLTDEIEEKLGLDEQYNYYIAFAYSTSSNGNNDYLKFIEYLFGKC